MEEDKSFSLASEPINRAEDNNHGWQKVTYAKKQRKTQNKKASNDSSRALPNGSGILTEKTGVFKGLEKHAEERRRKLEAQRAAAVYDDEDEIPRRSKINRGGDEDDDGTSSDADVKNNVAEVNKKEKPKKAKKPKVTVAEAAAKIDPDDLAAFLSSVSESYEGQQDIQLMRFADYFGRAFSAVSASQFPWLKLFRESPVAKIADVPVSYISESVYKTSVDWINHRSYEALGTIVVWSLDGILADLASQQLGSKGSKKGGQPASSKSQVDTRDSADLRTVMQSDFFLGVPPLRGMSRGFGCRIVLWAHHVLPILGGKSGSNPQTRDLVLQIVERIVGAPKARSILVSNAVRKGERLIPPVALDLLLRVTFPASSARVKATERFEVIYPLLKEVALAGSSGSKAMKQVALQIQSSTIKAAGEGNPALAGEATNIFIWCLSQNPDCYKQWDKIYVDNIEASVAALRKLAEGWKELSSKQSSLQALGETLKSFRQKNEKALSGDVDVHHQAIFKDADKYCKALSGRLSSGRACVKAMFFTIAVLAVGAAVASPNLDAWDWNKLSVYFNTHLSF
ncbi:UNVERIFIED_CONTAM: hypothetical protein Slati_1803800 [Sesamum latifolium]|uniref:Transmembrane protein n=1 Tax=Sesamum latifolium TaxID=2727402 RepID=A0AAW2X0J7_9LAMI